MEENTTTFVNLMIVIGLAMVVPIILSKQKRMQLPIVVGEIISGIIIGQSGFDIIRPGDPILEFLSHFGLIYLMFLSGIELDFSSLLFSPVKSNDKLKTNKKVLPAIHFGIISFLITILLAIGVAFLLTLFIPIKSPWMMALILSTTSLGVVVPVLKESNVINSHYGQSILVSSFIADFATMLLITVMVTLLSKGLSFDILLVIVLFALFFFLYRFGVFVNRVPTLQHTLLELSHATAQIKIRGAFALILIFIVMSDFLGTEVILGAFLAGVIIALIKRPNDAYIIEQLEAFGYGLFIPIFFITVGLNINLISIFQSTTALILVPILLLGAYLIKVVAAVPFMLGFSPKKGLAAGILLSSRLSLIIAASAIGLRMGLITDATNAAIILVAVFTVTLSPSIYMKLIGKSKKKQNPPILIIGSNQLGIQIAHQLRLHNDDSIIMDCEEDLLIKAKNNNFKTLFAQYDRSDLVFTQNLAKSEIIICAISDPIINYDVCKLIKTEFNVNRVISNVHNTNEITKYEQIGIETMNSALDRAVLMALIARNPAMYSLLTRTDDNKELEEIEVKNNALVGKKLKDLHLPGDVLILALRRGGELVVPHGDTQLNSGDFITIAGSIQHFEEVKSMLISL